MDNNADIIVITHHPQVDVPVVSDDDCRDSYGQNDIADSMICAGLDAGGKDSCQVRILARGFQLYLPISQKNLIILA